MEPRARYVVDCACTALGVSLNGRDAHSAISDFLEVPTVRVLQAWATSGSIEFSNTASLTREVQTAVIFTKRSSDPLTAENMASAVLMSKVSTPLETLHLAISELYGPVLLQSGQLDAKTASNLEQLESGLSSAMQRGDAGSSEEDVAGIVTPADECEHWRLNSMGYGVAASGPKAAEARGRAEQFWSILSPVADKLAGFTQLPHSEAAELLEQLQAGAARSMPLWHSLPDVLDGLHRMQFNESRMMHLMRVIGTALDGHAKQALARLKLWQDPFRKVSAALRESIVLCDAWAASTALLTSTFWVGSWKGGRFADDVLERLQERLREIHIMRTVQHQLLGLLTEREMAELRADEVFAPFEPLNALHHSQYSTGCEKWAMDTANPAVASDPWLQRDCLRHKELVLRPAIFAELAPAREALLGQMEGQLEMLREDFENRTGRHMGNGAAGGAQQSTGKNIPEVVSYVVLAKQLQDKVGEMLGAAETLLHDLQGMTRFLGRAQELHSYLNDYTQQQRASVL